VHLAVRGSERISIEPGWNLSTRKPMVCNARQAEAAARLQEMHAAQLAANNALRDENTRLLGEVESTRAEAQKSTRNSPRSGPTMTYFYRSARRPRSSSEPSSNTE
jgi:hypothetical protein